MTEQATATANTAVDTKVADTSQADAANSTAANATQTTQATTTTTQANVADTTANVVADKWGEKWREEYAQQDEKRLNQLKRYASPKAAMDALFAAQQKISSGQFKETLPENPTPEQVAEYRKNNGIPETFDKYDTTLPNGLVIGEADKPVVDKFLEKMHAQNASPAQVKSALTAYYEIQQDYLAQVEDTDQTYRNSSEDALRAEWGADYQRNLNMVVNLRDQMPEELQERIFGGRTADGKKLGDDPAFLNWFHSVAGEVNPIGTIMPSGTAGSMEGILAEQKSLQAKMGTKAYTQADRQRMNEINETLEKLKGRNAA